MLQLNGDELTGKVTEITDDAIKFSHAGVLQVMNVRNTNAKLVKAGVTRETLNGYTMDDICNILGVELLVDGTVLLNKISAQTFASSSYSDKTKYNPKDTNQRVSTPPAQPAMRITRRRSTWTSTRSPLYKKYGMF